VRSFARARGLPDWSHWTARLRASYDSEGQRAIYEADTVTGVQESAAARESTRTAPLSSTSLAASRVRPTFIAHRTDDEDSEVAWDEYEAFLQILADFSPGGLCMVNFEGEAFLASTRKLLLKQELRASARSSRVIFRALHHALGPAALARRASSSRSHVLMILTGCEWTPADGPPAPRYDDGEMMDSDEAARIIAVAMEEGPSEYWQTNEPEGDPYATLRWLPNYMIPSERAGIWTRSNREKWCRGTKIGHNEALSFVCIQVHYTHLFTHQVTSPRPLETE
jgi:hypothetical protein